MESQSFDSINLLYCSKTPEKFLEKIKRLSCNICSNIPLPPYRISEMKNAIFCMNCLKKQKQDKAKILDPIENELELLDHLIISCKNYKTGCKEVFNYPQKKVLLKHWEECKYSKARQMSFIADSPVKNFRDKQGEQQIIHILKNSISDLNKKNDSVILNLEQRINSLESEFSEFKRGTIRNTRKRETQLLLEKRMMLRDLKYENFKIQKKISLIRTMQKRNNVGIFYNQILKSKAPTSFYEKIQTFESKQNVLQFKKDPMLLKPDRDFVTINNYYGFGCANNICLFENQKKELILAYPSKSDALELVNLLSKEKIVSLKGHTNCIWCVRNYYDKLSNSYYLITSSKDKSIKIWKDNECFLTIRDAHKSQYLYSCLMLLDENKTYIVSSVESVEQMKVFDIDGKLVKQIGSDKDQTLFIDTCDYNGVRYLINCNNHDVKLFDFSTGNLFRKFQQDMKDSYHYSAFTDDKNLYESDEYGIFRVWDIESGNLLTFLDAYGVMLFGIIPWNNSCVFAAGYDGNVKIFDLEKKDVNSLSGLHKSSLGTLIKFYHESLGECLISAGGDNKICLLR